MKRNGDYSSFSLYKIHISAFRNRPQNNSERLKVTTQLLASPRQLGHVKRQSPPRARVGRLQYQIKKYNQHRFAGAIRRVQVRFFLIVEDESKLNTLAAKMSDVSPCKYSYLVSIAGVWRPRYVHVLDLDLLSVLIDRQIELIMEDIFGFPDIF